MPMHVRCVQSNNFSLVIVWDSTLEAGDGNHFLLTFFSVTGAYQFMTLRLFMNKRGCTYWMAKVDWFWIHLLFEGEKKELKCLFGKPTVIVELLGCYKAERRANMKFRLSGTELQHSYDNSDTLCWGSTSVFIKCPLVWHLLGSDMVRKASSVQLAEAEAKAHTVAKRKN